MYQILINITITLFLLTGCGTGTSKLDPQTPNLTSKSILNKSAKKYFGYISDATINIYELGEGEKKLLFSENTTLGETFDEIGNFNAHTESLNSQKFYLYELKGGENWDINNDNIIDSISTKNSSTYRAIYKGKNSHVAWWGSKRKATTLGLSEKF